MKSETLIQESVLSVMLGPSGCGHPAQRARALGYELRIARVRIQKCFTHLLSPQDANVDIHTHLNKFLGPLAKNLVKISYWTTFGTTRVFAVVYSLMETVICQSLKTQMGTPGCVRPLPSPCQPFSWVLWG